MCDKDKQYDLFGDQADKQHDSLNEQDKGGNRQDSRIVNLEPADPEGKVGQMVQQEMENLETIQRPLTVRLIGKILIPHSEGLLKVAAKMYRDDPTRWCSCIKVIAKLVAIIRKLF
ncbi:MAG: hypothetical protein DBP02_01990 [gamma proteobacterium symbiont of Ctena orbiculata]|nr:MAG: hypothetical protein DBP02_01990 [gamma proteobacterium symbiont of Ctena orbiculata]